MTRSVRTLRFVVCLLLASAPSFTSDAEPITVSAQASGSANPPVLMQPSQQNGDFTIMDGDGPCDISVGNGQDEATTWSFDLSDDPEFAAFDASTGPLTVAKLELTLTPRPTTQCAPGDPPGITTDVVRIAGLAALVRSEIQSLPVNVTTPVEISLFPTYTEAQILNAISGGAVQFEYSDDAVVSFARLTLTKAAPDVPAIGVVGQAITMTTIAVLGALAARSAARRKFSR